MCAVAERESEGLGVGGGRGLSCKVWLHARTDTTLALMSGGAMQGRCAGAEMAPRPHPLLQTHTSHTCTSSHSLSLPLPPSPSFTSPHHPHRTLTFVRLLVCCSRRSMQQRWRRRSGCGQRWVFGGFGGGGGRGQGALPITRGERGCMGHCAAVVAVPLLVLSCWPSEGVARCQQQATAAAAHSPSHAPPCPAGRSPRAPQTPFSTPHSPFSTHPHTTTHH